MHKWKLQILIPQELQLSRHLLDDIPHATAIAMKKSPLNFQRITKS